MKRREVLRNVSALGTAAIAGSAVAGARRRRNPCDVQDGTRRTRRTRNQCLRPQYVGDVSFDVRPVDSGELTREATITFRDDGRAVHVDGYTWVPTPCTELVLDDVSFDPETQTLTIALDERNEDSLCVQAIAYRDYRVYVTMATGTVRRVDVVHEGEAVARATRDQA